MSGLLALLDDVAAIAKVAAASVDDVVGAAAKAGTKAAGLVIDDAAVTPKYVTGFSAKRELPIIWKITKGSLRNKLIILLPLLLLLQSFVPQVIPWLLMLGGGYLCFEGAEKVLHALSNREAAIVEKTAPGDPLKLEEEKVSGAIKTDFILSAEIMVLSLSIVEEPNIWMKIAVLAVVGVMITVGVYGAVAVIVKMDDIGMHLAAKARTSPIRALGRGMIRAMPILLTFLTIVGTAAMLWVGGNIILHGLEQTGAWGWPYEQIKAIAAQVAAGFSSAQGFVAWAATAIMDGIFGLIFGLLLVPLVVRVIGPAYGALTGKKPSSH